MIKGSLATNAHLYTKYMGTSSAYSTYRAKPKSSSNTKGKTPHLQQDSGLKLGVEDLHHPVER